MLLTKSARPPGRMMVPCLTLHGYPQRRARRLLHNWGERMEGLAQEFAVPDDYVPPQTFLRSFARNVLQGHTCCIILSSSPGIGKSTFISYLYQRFREKQIPVVRHHYDLGTGDHAPGF